MAEKTATGPIALDPPATIFSETLPDLERAVKKLSCLWEDRVHVREQAIRRVLVEVQREGFEAGLAVKGARRG